MQSPPAKVGTKTARPHAFVVDDEPQIRTVVAEILASTGFIPHELKSAVEVEAGLIQWPPSLIVLDLSLGGSDAIEVIRSLSAMRYAGDVLLITGHRQETLNEVQEIGTRRRLNMLPPLRKPFRIEELRERLANTAERTTKPADAVSLEAALRNDWLELWYQPKIDLRSMLVCGAEALIRLRHPTEGLVAPADFLPRPADALYHPLTDYVVRKALSDWSVFAQYRMTNRLAINVPASVLQRPSFVANVRENLPHHPKFPGLIVEITEDEAINDPLLAREIAVQLKLYNIHVSIDDFGTGYSSLARLSELPFAEIKLDRSFVHGCADDEKKREMCKVVIELANRFQITAVAEGVETHDDLRVLIECGYPVAQGYLFAKPMQSRDFVSLITSHALH